MSEHSLTSYATEQSQCGCIPSKTIKNWVRVALGDRNSHGNGFVELSPARLQGDNGTEGGLVAKELSHNIYIHWLCL